MSNFPQTKPLSSLGRIGRIILKRFMYSQLSILSGLKSTIEKENPLAAIYVLLVFGLAALAFELTQPGFGFAGFAGVGMVALGVYGLTVVPFSRLGLVLLVGGNALMTADVLIRKLGLLTALGAVAFVAGSFLTFGGTSDLIRVSPWLIGFTTLASVLYYGFGLTVAVQSRERITSTQKGLVGLVGETRGDLDPDGPVFVKGTLWRGRSQAGAIFR